MAGTESKIHVVETWRPRNNTCTSKIIWLENPTVREIDEIRRKFFRNIWPRRIYLSPRIDSFGPPPVKGVMAMFETGEKEAQQRDDARQLLSVAAISGFCEKRYKEQVPPAVEVYVHESSQVRVASPDGDRVTDAR